MTSLESNNEREGCVIHVDVVSLWILTETNRFNPKLYDFHASTFDSKLKVSNSRLFSWKWNEITCIFMVNTCTMVKSARFLWRKPHRLTITDLFMLHLNHVFCFTSVCLYCIKVSCTRGLGMNGLERGGLVVGGVD